MSTTTFRETHSGIVATRGKRELHMLGTSVAAMQLSRQLLATHSFNILYTRANSSPLKNVRAIVVGTRLMLTPTNIADRIKVERISPRKWAVKLDGNTVYSDQTKSWCSHWAERVIVTETANPGSSVVLAGWEARTV
jgi:hypothetical protein